MVSQAHRRLSDDHHTVGTVLQELLTALENQNVQASYSRLDLFWARLAVHIRAEHLHLFPTILNYLANSGDAVSPTLSEAQAVVETLRADHDFFMRELGRAIQILRELPKLNDADSDAKLMPVLHAVREIEKRLASHNDFEETQIYHWASTILTDSEQMELAARINAELENRPARFSEEAWTQ